MPEMQARWWIRVACRTILQSWLPASVFWKIHSSIALCRCSVQQVKCENCGCLFRQPASPKTSVARLATAILLLHVAGGPVAVALVCSPETTGIVPQPVFVKDLILMMSGHAEAFMLLVVTTAIATLSLCVIASAASSIAQRRRFSKEFELRPKRNTTMDHEPSPRNGQEWLYR